MMKPAGIVLALTLAITLTATAQLSPPPSAEVEKIIAEPTPTPKTSPAVSQQLADKLPKYTPPASEADKPAATAANPAPEAADAGANSDILHLKKVTVTPRKRPRLTDDVMMTTKAYNDKLAKEKLSSLDRNVLNKFTLPSWFGGVSAAERARDERDRDQRAQMANDVFGLAKVVEVTDPEQAKALRDAVNRP
jgi:hypothetical protein